MTEANLEAVETPAGEHKPVKARPTTRGPRYEAATAGFRNYWYPVAPSSRLGEKPMPVKMLGEELMFMRHDGTAYAIHDLCAHRGVPLSKGRVYFPGHITCVYHGFTFDLKTGQCSGILTDGPNSPLVARTRVRSYPVAERAGFIWVYMGDRPAPPVEDDIPDEMLVEDVAVECRIAEWKCNWRAAVENGTDHAHALTLHRRDPWWIHKKMPAWRDCETAFTPDGKWLTRKSLETKMSDDYPGLGRWPTGEWYRFSNIKVLSRVRLPGIVAQSFEDFHHLRWAVPVDEHTTRNYQFAVTRGNALKRGWFHLRYWLWIRWMFHVLFNGTDQWLLERLDYSAPEAMFRPDRVIIDWRKWCESAR